MKPNIVFQFVKYILVHCLILFICLTSFSQTRRALLIGINNYKATNATEQAVIKSRASMQNLDGCQNDICAIQAIIKARYGFEEKNIDTICNTNASRTKIISSLKHLDQISKKGDIVLIYYSGHGSQVYNSLSVHPDKLDQSIVPSDLIDIRDKELSVYFNLLTDKGVTLTLIFDNCYSGSIARGSVPNILKTRKMSENPVDAKDPSNPPNPEDKGVLVFSACQPDEPAYETFDENRNSFGAFTYALFQALQSSPVNEPAQNIFLKTKALLQQKEIKQEPVIGGTNERKERGLFGDDSGKLNGKTIVPVLSVMDKQSIILQGGQALNLNKNCALINIKDNDTTRVIISEVLGLTRSLAKIEKGATATIKTGDFFTLERWAPADKPILTIYFPKNNYTSEQIKKIANNFYNSLNNVPGIHLVKDPSVENPTHFIQYYKNRWVLTFANENKEIDLGTIPDYKLANKNLNSSATVFIQLPPSKELINMLDIGKKSHNSAVEISSEPFYAQYFLVGRIENDSLQYALIKPIKNLTDTNYLNTQPVCTDWINDRQNCGEKLTDIAIRLGKIRGWLSLQAPDDEGAFPFSLGLKNIRTQHYIEPGMVVYEDDKVEVFLRTTKEKIKSWNSQKRYRYVYIFAIDKTGKMTQIFPQNNINYGNKLPTSSYQFEEEIPLGVKFRISIPFGTDTYFLLTSEEVITAYQAFNSSGVITRGSLKGPNSADNELTKLLNNVGTTSRGGDPAAPTTWSLEKFTVISKPR